MVGMSYEDMLTIDLTNLMQDSRIYKLCTQKSTCKKVKNTYNNSEKLAITARQHCIQIPSFQEFGMNFF